MSGTTVVRDGDYLGLVPSFGTIGSPVVAAVILGGALAYGLYQLAAGALAGQPVNPDALPMLLGYGTFSVLLFVGAVLWWRSNARPVVIDRAARRVPHLGPYGDISRATGVRVRECSSDGDDYYQVDILLPGREKVVVGRIGWREETNRAKAEAVAAAVAEFLGLPFVNAPAALVR